MRATRNELWRCIVTEQSDVSNMPHTRNEDSDGEPIIELDDQKWLWLLKKRELRLEVDHRPSNRSSLIGPFA